MLKTWLLLAAVACWSVRGHFTVHYWELKPYIYSEDGVVKGMFVDLFAEMKRIDAKCESAFAGHHQEKSSISNAIVYAQNRSESLPAFIAHNKGYILDPQNQNKSTIWFPVVGNHLEHATSSFDVVYDDTLAIVVLQESLDIMHKFMSTCLSVLETVIIAILLVIMCSFLLRVLDWDANPAYSNTTFIKGLGTAIWLSAASFTAVGYGDVTPKSPLAKTMATVFIMAGMIFASSFTALITELFHSHNYFTDHHKMAVLQDSYEGSFPDYLFNQSQITGYQTYEEVVDSVRRSETDFAILPRDVAAYMQDTWNLNHDWQERLVIATTLQGTENPVKLLVYGPGSNDINMECDTHSVLEARKYGITRHRKKLKIFNSQDVNLSESLTKRKYIQIIYLLVVTLIVVGVCFDIGKWLQGWNKPKGTEIEVVDMAKHYNIKIEIDKEEFISLQIEVRLINAMLQELLENQARVEVEYQEIIETQTVPPLSRAASRASSLERPEPELRRTGSFPKEAIQNHVYRARKPVSRYQSFPRLTNELQDRTNPRNRYNAKKRAAQIRRYETFHNVTNGSAPTGRRNNRSKVKRGQTLVVPNGYATPTQRQAMKLKRGESFPARYHAQIPIVNGHGHRSVPRSVHQIRSRPSLQNIEFNRQETGQIGNISIDYGNENPVFVVEDTGNIVITEC